MATKRDYYEILGVSKDADEKTIKKAYRELAMKHHPDRNKEPGAEEKFKEISEAYGVLSDKDKKVKYDQYGHAGIDGRYSQEDIFGGIDLNDIFGGGGGYGGSIFDNIFGGGGRTRRGPQRGSDLQYNMEIEFMDAAHGKETTITIPRDEICETCKGSGAKEGTSPKTCTACRGSGQVTQVRRTPLGNFAQSTTCSTCRGEGKIIDNPCTTCHGSGKVRKTRSISIKIPAGVDTGGRLRISREGEAGSKGGPPGDLYVVLHVKAHKFFERLGDDIMFELPLSFPQLALGCEVEVPTLSDKVKMKIPAGTQVNATFRLKGKGMTKLHGRGNGDLHVKIGVVVPTKLSAEQKKLLHEFDKTNGNGDKCESVLCKVKKLFD